MPISIATPGRECRPARSTSLMVADEAAFEAAMTLPEPERLAVAARLSAQAETLERLAVRAGDGQGSEAFRLAAQRALSFAASSSSAIRARSAPPGPAATNTPQRTPTAAPDPHGDPAHGDPNAPGFAGAASPHGHP